MKTWKQGIFGILAIIALTFAFIACDDGKDTHTHEWEWKVTTPATPTADGLETETCKTCRETRGTRPIAMETKTYPITLKDGTLVFTVAYKAMPTDAEPAYLTYLQTRLETIAASEGGANVSAINSLINKGGRFNINVEYGGTSYGGLVWNNTTKTFTTHNDWISTATGTTGDNALTLVGMRETFESVEMD